MHYLSPNGVGKSTLLKCITKSIEHGGSVKYGHNVELSYFAQNQAEELDPNKTIFDTVDEIAKGELRTRLRSILGAFLFSGEDADKKFQFCLVVKELDWLYVSYS